VQHVVETPFPATSLGFFSPENKVTVSDEHCERFHQDIYRMGKRQRQMGTQICMLADYGCTHVRETPLDEYRRQKTTK
jgi:hypothetical protein